MKKRHLIERVMNQLIGLKPIWKEILAIATSILLFLILLVLLVTGILPWYRAHTLMAMILIFLGGIVSIIKIFKYFHPSRNIQQLNRELETLVSPPDRAFLDLTGLDLSVFPHTSRLVFCSTELAESGIHWLDIIYFQVLGIFCKYGFVPHVLVSDYGDNPGSPEEQARRIDNLRKVASIAAASKVQVHSIDLRTSIRLPMKDLFIVLDETSKALSQEHSDTLLAKPSRASKSLLWSIFLFWWLRDRKGAPIIKLQWAVTAHRYEWLRNYGCQFLLFPDEKFVTKPAGPYLDCSNWLGTMSTLLEWLKELPPESRNVFASQLAMITGSVDDTWMNRLKELLIHENEIARNFGELLTLFETFSPIANARPDNMTGRIGWLLANRLREIGLEVGKIADC